MLAELPDDVRRDFEREGFTAEVLRTQRQQARTFLDELAAWRGAAPDLGSIPVTVISGGRTGNGKGPAIRAEANASHAHRAAQSTQGRHVIAARSNHYVPFTEPDVIAAEIAKLLQTG